MKNAKSKIKESPKHSFNKIGTQKHYLLLDIEKGLASYLSFRIINSLENE